VSDEKSNGAANAHPELTPEQQEELKQFLLLQKQQQVSQTIQLGLLTLDPNERAKLVEEHVIRMAAVVVDGMPGLARAIEDVADDAAVDAHPYWGFKLIDRKGTVLGATVVPKRITRAKDPSEVIQYLATLSFILSPVPHFVANLLGLRLEIVQTAVPPQAHSKIIV
jgi:hypothetical protein